MVTPLVSCCTIANNISRLGLIVSISRWHMTDLRPDEEGMLKEKCAESHYGPLS